MPDHHGLDLTGSELRQGRSQPRNLYLVTGDDWSQHVMIGQADTAEIAARIVETWNADVARRKTGEQRDAELYWQAHEARHPSRPGDDLPEGEPSDSMDDLIAGAEERAAGTEVRARCSVLFGPNAMLELPGEAEPARWPAREIAEAVGLAAPELPGRHLLVTVRETPGEGRVLSGFRLVR